MPRSSVNNSSDESTHDAPLRYDDCIFHPTSLDPGFDDMFNSISGSEYVTENQLQSKISDFPQDPFLIYHTNIRSVEKNFDLL